MFAIHASRSRITSRTSSASRSSPNPDSASGSRHSPLSTRGRPGAPPRANASSSTASTRSSSGDSCSRKMFQKIASAPCDRSTRSSSATVSGVANQWKASPEKTASTAASPTGIDSALPASAAGPGTTSSSTARIRSSGSTATTRANRGTRRRVSLPVPAPRSSTSASRPSPRSATTRSSSPAGHSGRPSSYSRAVRPNASGGASLGDTGEERVALLPDHLAGDHEALDLVRALVDLRDLRVAHHALDGVLLDVAVPAEDLHRVRRHRHCDVAAEELRHRRELRQLGPVDAVVDHLAAAVEKAARRLAARLHVGEHAGDELVAADGLAERLASLRVLDREVGRPLGEAERLRGD